MLQFILVLPWENNAIGINLFSVVYIYSRKNNFTALELVHERVYLRQDTEKCRHHVAICNNYTLACEPKICLTTLKHTHVHIK